MSAPAASGTQPPPLRPTAVPTDAAARPTHHGSRPVRRLINDPVWRVRGLLALIAVWAATVYAWGITRVSLHEYYAPAVKSMSVSWRAWFYGGYDPDASITLDKLPGAFMIQALSVRIFGYHTWSVVLPQVIAAVLSVLLLFRLVKRWQGPVAGLLAAAFLATTPILAALAHSQISDGLLVLFLVLAADAGSRALGSSGVRHLLLCSLWIGLAFQTKMAQAWGIVPAIGLAYLIVAPGRLRIRSLRAVAAGALCVVVSFWQVLLFALTPASSRPYADGSTNNSLLSMIFEYNLSSRFDTGSAGGAPGGGGPSDGGGPGSGTNWSYLFTDGIAPQIGWLYPLALTGLVLGLIGWRRLRNDGTGRTDAVRGVYVMWGAWLTIHAVAFSTGRVAHEFYVVAIAPPLAALAGAGAARLWEMARGESWTRWLAPGVLAVELAWTVHLCGQFPDFRSWLRPAILAIGLLAVVALLLPALLHQRAPRAALGAGALLSVAGVLLAPATWAASTVDANYLGSSRAPTAGPAGDGFGGRSGLGGKAGMRMPDGQGSQTGQGPQGGQGSPGGQGSQNGQASPNGQGPQGGQGAPGESGGQGSQNGQGTTGQQNGQGVPGAQNGSGTAGTQNDQGIPDGQAPSGSPSGQGMPGGTQASGGLGGRGGGPGGQRGGPGMDTSRVQPLVNYLKKQRNGEKYAVAVQGSSSAGTFILAGLDVLPMGGFSGSIPFPTSSHLADLIKKGKVRYVVLGGGMGGPGPSGRDQNSTDSLQTWVTQQCTAVDSSEYDGSTSSGKAASSDEASGSSSQQFGNAGGGSAQSLYDCKSAS